MKMRALGCLPQERVLYVLVALAATVMAAPGLAQSVSGFGQSWNGFYGFSSPSDRSVSLQRAEAIRQAEQGALAPVYNTYNDNRSNYIETNTSGGNVSGDSQIGNQIGEQTYSVGALNTGSTTITVDGSGNTITADNTASSNGCVDGSIIHSTSTNGVSGESALNAGTSALDGASPYIAVTKPATISSTCTTPP